MSQIDRLNPYLQGPVTIRAPKMTLLARDFEPPLAEGEGEFEIVSEREFRYRMTGLPVDMKHSLQALNRERDEPYDPLNRFRLVMTDADGTEWMGGWTVPDVDPDGDQWVLQGTVQSLSAVGQGPATGEGSAEARFLIPRNHTASIFFRRFVQSDDGKGGLQAIRTIEALGVPVRFAFDSEPTCFRSRLVAARLCPRTMRRTGSENRSGFFSDSWCFRVWLSVGFRTGGRCSGCDSLLPGLQIRHGPLCGTVTTILRTMAISLLFTPAS